MLCCSRAGPLRSPPRFSPLRVARTLRPPVHRRRSHSCRGGARPGAARRQRRLRPLRCMRGPALRNSEKLSLGLDGIDMARMGRWAHLTAALAAMFLLLGHVSQEGGVTRTSLIGKGDQLVRVPHRATPDARPPGLGSAHYRQATLADEALLPASRYGGRLHSADRRGGKGDHPVDAAASGWGGRGRGMIAVSDATKNDIRRGRISAPVRPRPLCWRLQIRGGLTRYRRPAGVEGLRR